MPALEPLGVQHQVLAVLDQQFDEVAATAAEGEDLAVERVMVELLGDEGGQAVEPAPHVRRSGDQSDPHLGRRPIILAAPSPPGAAAELKSASTRTRIPLCNPVSINPADWSLGRIDRRSPAVRSDAPPPPAPAQF